MSIPISIITTLHNCETYVLESLDSIASQSFQDFEWIILDDGSTDMTNILVEEFISNHKNLNIIWKKDSNNIKIPRRRNEAIDMASGEYIVIHDGDDISLENRLNTQINFMKNNSETFCVGSYAVRIDSDGIEDGIMSYPPESHYSIVRSLLNARKNPMIDPTTMFKRNDFIRLGKYTLDTSIYTVPDMHFWCRAILDDLIFRNISMPLIKYRVNPDGMTRKHNDEMIRSHMSVWFNFAKKYREKRENNAE